MRHIKQLSVFQKLQIISGIIPFYSFLLTFIVTFIVCWKSHKNFVRLVIIGACYFIIYSLLWKVLSSLEVMILPIFICALIALIGNSALIQVQIACKQT